MTKMWFSEQRHGSIKLPWRIILLTLIATAFWLFAGAAPKSFVFDRTLIAQGELWRLITGHWVHSDAEHALWDITALLVLGTFFEKRLKQQLFIHLFLGTIAIDLWIWWGMPQLIYYCGLSGILNTLLVTGLISFWKEQQDRLIPVIISSAFVKNLFEWKLDFALMTSTAWPTVPIVHIVGMLTGFLVIFISYRKSIISGIRYIVIPN